MTHQIFVSYITTFGGVERLILSLSEFLSGKNVPHKVICFQDTLGLQNYAQWPLEVTPLAPKRACLSEVKALRNHFRSAQSGTSLVFDLKGAFYAGLANLRAFNLHLTDPPSLLATESSRASMAYRRWSHDTHPFSLRQKVIGDVVHRINRRGVRRARSVIAMTERISSELRTLYDAMPVVIRPGVPQHTPIAFNSPEPSNTIRILSVSRLEESKRINLAIDAVAKLNACQSDNHPFQWSLDIVGSGPALDSLRQYASRRGVSEKVAFLGRVSDEQLESCYQSASIFVMPAVQGYGLPALEALRRRVPVVLHKDSGVSEILNNSNWAEVIEKSDDLPNALQRLSARLHERTLTEASLPFVPTDKQWAEQVCQQCGWVS